ncbi:hypothetical protein H5410_051214 [Solanum commersonii]|uniref:Uncharacterized protein n=1 Tax=Solanum commersonii TaxID=4109 RepID=A0A9J5WXR4_SOLCO|nr:hypothetical protein H5410_051214 [Solanum commersonii]
MEGDRITHSTGFSAGQLPFKYLGILLFTLKLSIQWTPLSHRLQLFLIPEKVLKLIDFYCKSFLWPDTNTISQKSLVAWEIICTARSIGGLNLINIRRVLIEDMMNKNILDIESHVMTPEDLMKKNTVVDVENHVVILEDLMKKNVVDVDDQVIVVEEVMKTTMVDIENHMMITNSRSLSRVVNPNPH